MDKMSGELTLFPLRVQSAKSMPWIPLENYDTDIANIASNFFDNRRRYVYPWNSHPYF